MCGGWSSGGRSGGGPSVTQLKARPRPRPGHITTILLQPLQSAAAPQMGRTPPPGPRHHDVVTPDIGWQLHQAPGLACVKCTVCSVSGAFPERGERPGEWTLQLAGSWGLVQTPECRSETGPGLGLNTEHNTATDTCHYTQLRRTQWQPWPAKIKFFGSVKTISWERRDEFFTGYEWYGVELDMNGLWSKKDCG